MVVKLAVKNVFGFSTTTRNNLIVIDDRNIVYACGNQLILLNPETKDQTIIATTNSNISKGISALSYCSNKKLFAVAERLKTTIQVLLYDSNTWKRKRIISFPSTETSEIFSITFSHDGKYLLTQSKFPDYSLILWNIEKTPVIVTTTRTSISEDLNINQILFSPYDSSVILIVGKTLLKLFRIQDNQLRGTTLKRDPLNYTCICWLTNELVLIGTDMGDVFLFENMEFKGTIISMKDTAASFIATTTTTTTGTEMTSMMSTSSIMTKRSIAVINIMTLQKGEFLVTYSDGIMNIYDSYDHTRDFKSTLIPSIYGSALHISMLNMDTVILSTTGGQLLSFSLGTLDQAVESQCFEPLFTFFHESTMTNIIATSNNNNNNNNNIDNNSTKRSTSSIPMTTMSTSTLNGKNTINTTSAVNDYVSDGCILAIGTSLWKPFILVTIGKDATLRTWNIQDKRMETALRLGEDPCSLSVHPNGLFVSVGLETKIKIFSILLDTFQLIHQLPVRNSNCMVFSHSGHLLAAVSGSTIHIYDTYSGNLMTSLRGHNNRIKSLIWTKTDNELYSYGFDHRVIQWSIYPTADIKKEYNLTAISPGASVSNTLQSDGRYFYSTKADNTLKRTLLNMDHLVTTNSTTMNNSTIGSGSGSHTGSRILDLGGNRDDISVLDTNSVIDLHSGNNHSTINNNQDKDMPLTCPITTMMVDEIRNILFLGSGEDVTNNTIGCIYITPTTMDIPFNIFNIHAYPVTAMCQSYDGAYLYTADSSGCLIVSEITYNEAKLRINGKMTTNDTTNPYLLKEEILINLNDLYTKKAEIKKLQQKIKEVTFVNHNALIEKEIEYEKKLNLKAKDYYHELTYENEEGQTILTNKMNLNNTNTTKINTEKSFLEEQYQNLVTKFTLKINQEKEKYENIQTDITTIEQTWKMEQETILTEHKTKIQELITEYENKLSIQMMLQKSLQEEKINMQNMSKSHMTLMKNDVDNESRDLRQIYETKFRQQEDTIATLTITHTATKNDLTSIQKDVALYKEDVLRCQDKEKRVLDNIRSLENDLQQQKKDIREKEEVISEKDKKMADLKKKNQELEKFRFVLDYKIKELKLQITPSEQQIAVMTKQVDDMKNELLQYQKSAQSLTVMINELTLKLNGIKHEITHQDKLIDYKHLLIDKQYRALKELQALQEDPMKLKPKLITLHRLFENMSFDTLPPDIFDDTNISPNKPKTGTFNTAGNTNTGNKNLKFELTSAQLNNRDRDQMERSLISMKRLYSTSKLAQKRDVTKKVHEYIELQKELDILRQDTYRLEKQREYIESTVAKNEGYILKQKDLHQLMVFLGYERHNAGSDTEEDGDEDAEDEGVDREGEKVGNDNHNGDYYETGHNSDTNDTKEIQNNSPRDDKGSSQNELPRIDSSSTSKRIHTAGAAGSRVSADIPNLPSTRTVSAPVGTRHVIQKSPNSNISPRAKNGTDSKQRNKLFLTEKKSTPIADDVSNMYDIKIWDQINEQNEIMSKMESDIYSLCTAMGIDPLPMIQKIDTDLILKEY